MQPEEPCPCGSAAAFAACCGPHLDGAPAPDAESLMRSRYCAYVLGREDYLLATWDERTRPVHLDMAAPPAPRWLGLKVLGRRSTGAETATVEFVARYKIGGRAHRMHEVSRFERRDGRWYYLDGVVD